MAYWYVSPKVYVVNYVTEFTELSGYVNNSISLWNNALGMEVSCVNNLSSANIIIYGVTKNKYYEITNEIWDDRLYGFTSVPENPVLGSLWATYSGTTKQIKIFDGELIKIYVLYDAQRDEQSTVTHEIGHALGYLGNSTNSLSIMHSGQTTSSAGITFEEQMHLTQVSGKVKVKKQNG